MRGPIKQTQLSDLEFETPDFIERVLERGREREKKEKRDTK